MEELQKFYSSKRCKYLTHDIHPYPHKIVPQVAKLLIERYSSVDDTIIDFGCGSGTTLLEANLLGRSAIGVDINPIACLIAKVKVTKIKHDELQRSVQQLIGEVNHHLSRDGTLRDYTQRLHPEIPEFKYRDKWFCKNALLGLSVVRELIKRIDDKEVRDFCLVAFSFIIKEVSQASAFYRLTKTKRFRYVSLLQIAHFFNCKLLEMVRMMKQLPENPSLGRVFQADAKCFTFEKVDLIICNLPKYNMDFPRCFKIYCWWLDFNVNLIDKNVIGTTKRKKDYYRDLELLLKNAYRLLKEGKFCAILVNDSYENGSHLEHAMLVKQIGLKTGFTLHEQIVRTIPKRVLPFVKKDRREDVLIFRRV